jgi:glutamate formiminotransferase
VLAAIDYTTVLVALIAAIPATLAALGTLQIRRQIQTPSKTSIGRQIEDVNHTARANNYHLQAMGSDMGTATPPEAAAEVKQVNGLEGVTLKDPEPGVG